jgi:hypothetical protein
MPTQDHFAAQEIIPYRGFDIVHQFDARGEDGENYYSIVTVDFRGEECDFNTVEDAERWLDEQVDGTENNDEHRLRSWELA